MGATATEFVVAFDEPGIAMNLIAVCIFSLYLLLDVTVVGLAVDCLVPKR